MKYLLRCPYIFQERLYFHTGAADAILLKDAQYLYLVVPTDAQRRGSSSPSACAHYDQKKTLFLQHSLTRPLRQNQYKITGYFHEGLEGGRSGMRVVIFCPVKGEEADEGCGSEQATYH